MITLDNYRQATPTDPIRIGPGIWWVGNHREQEMFQAHSYLIEAGNDSILVDPGSEWNFRHSLEKIRQVMPFERIRYFICQHSDPDITAALPCIDRLVARDDAAVVTHWRSAQLLQHYNIRMPFWCIEEHGWQLAAATRRLRFLFTPYAHFPGAFTTFDEATGILFSSDLFGGQTEGFLLLAEDESYFEALRPFHEHYMPSREVLFNAMARIEEQDVRMIAPQHGSIIRGPLIPIMIEKLKSLECGLFLLANGSTNIERLSLLNRVLHDTRHALITHREFNAIIVELTRLMRQIIPVDFIDFYAMAPEEGVLHFAPANRYRGTPCTVPAEISPLLGASYNALPARQGCRLRSATLAGRPTILLALPPHHGETVRLVAAIVLTRTVDRDDVMVTMLSRMEVPLQVALERETLYRILDLEKRKIYERSVRDPLTGCYNRTYMHDVLTRQFEMQDRGQAGIATTVAMYDIDNFKEINDSYGHNQGDAVLRRIGQLILETARAGDLAVRLGGEEFAVFIFADAPEATLALAERIRLEVAALSFEGMGSRRVTVSGGIAVRRRNESFETFLGRADEALYQAKHAGRNAIVVA